MSEQNNSDTCCYTHDQLRDIDWRETASGGIEWFSLFDRSRSERAPCDHDDDECPAKRDFRDDCDNDQLEEGGVFPMEL